MNGPSLIDADVHVDAPYLEALHPYLPDHWIEHFTQSLDRGASPPPPPATGAPKLTHNTWHAPPYHPPNSPVADRAGGARAVNGGGLERLRREVLDADGVEAAVTSCLYPVDRLGNPDAAAQAAGVHRLRPAQRTGLHPGSLPIPVQALARPPRHLRHARSQRRPAVRTGLAGRPCPGTRRATPHAPHGGTRIGSAARSTPGPRPC